MDCNSPLLPPPHTQQDGEVEGPQLGGSAGISRMDKRPDARHLHHCCRGRPSLADQEPGERWLIGERLTPLGPSWNGLPKRETRDALCRPGSMVSANLGIIDSIMHSLSRAICRFMILPKGLQIKRQRQTKCLMNTKIHQNQTPLHVDGKCSNPR